MAERAKINQFIDEVYHTPYSLLKNNCMHKSIKIVEKARELGLDANLVFAPVSIAPRRTFPYLPSILPHCYALVEGEEINVAQDPATGQTYCKNSEIISFAPSNISETRRILYSISAKENTVITLGKLTLISIFQSLGRLRK